MVLKAVDERDNCSYVHCHEKWVHSGALLGQQSFSLNEELDIFQVCISKNPREESKERVDILESSPLIQLVKNVRRIEKDYSFHLWGLKHTAHGMYHSLTTGQKPSLHTSRLDGPAAPSILRAILLISCLSIFSNKVE